jgi:hypothetical protein
MNLFDRLNQETRDWNNGISRNIDPTSPSNCKMKASDLLANYNNYTYKRNNGQYPDRLYR